MRGGKMSVVKLPVTNGPMTLVDHDVAEKLKGKKLFHTSSGRYVGFMLEGKKIRLHRFVMNDPVGLQVDHLNGDRYNNTRSNLRACTNSENMLNIRTETKSKSGYRHVYFRKDRPTFRVSHTLNYKIRHLCVFRSRHIAGIFADQVLVNLVGPFVKKNFPEKITSSCLEEFLKGTSGKIFRIVFSRRSDGHQREMVCRTGVNSRHHGGTIPFDPISMNLFSVYDVQKRAYRFIPLENVICIRFAKTNYRVVA
jgi:hypothetical protein